jgi:hypothetical protein
VLRSRLSIRQPGPSHYEPPGLSSGRKVVDGDLAKGHPVQDDGDVLT